MATTVTDGAGAVAAADEKVRRSHAVVAWILRVKRRQELLLANLYMLQIDVMCCSSEEFTLQRSCKWLTPIGFHRHLGLRAEARVLGHTRTDVTQVRQRLPSDICLG